MKPFEALLIITNLLALLLAVRPAAGRGVGHLALAAPLVAVVQVVAEGWRWQLVPAYALAGLTGLVWAKRSFSPVSGRNEPPQTEQFATRLTVWVGALGLAISALLPTIFPVFHFPPPGGPYKIGTITYCWADATRPELFSSDPRNRRELLVQVWYPAQPNSADPRTRYLPDVDTVMGTFARLQHLPAFVFGHFRYVRTNAVAAVPVAAASPRYPVLLFLEGVTGFRQMSTFQVEELVSQGYIVAALDQPGTAAAVVFSDGHQVLGQPVAQLRPLIQASYALAAGLPLPALPGRALADPGLVPYLAQDVSFVLNRLAALNKADPAGRLTGRLDLSRTGIFGVSLGGIVAAEACRQDPRLRACLVLDAPVPTAVVWTGQLPPTMWLTRDVATMRLERQRAGGWPEVEIQAQQSTMHAAYQRLPGAGYLVQLRGAFHSNFMDLPTWLPLAGPIDGQRAHAIVNAYSVAFFDQHLRGRPAPLLTGPAAAYPEVLFESRRP